MVVATVSAITIVTILVAVAWQTLSGSHGDADLGTNAEPVTMRSWIEAMYDGVDETPGPDATLNAAQSIQTQDPPALVVSPAAARDEVASTLSWSALNRVALDGAIDDSRGVAASTLAWSIIAPETLESSGPLTAWGKRVLDDDLDAAAYDEVALPAPPSYVDSHVESKDVTGSVIAWTRIASQHVQASLLESPEEQAPLPDLPESASHSDPMGREGVVASVALWNPILAHNPWHRASVELQHVLGALGITASDSVHKGAYDEALSRLEIGSSPRVPPGSLLHAVAQSNGTSVSRATYDAAVSRKGTLHKRPPGAP